MAAPPASAVVVGRDLARVRARRPGVRGPLRAAVLGFLLAALALAVLRTDILRLRYGLGEAVRTHAALLQEQHALIAEVRGLRDPARLARTARQQGFARPERVIDLRPATAATDRP